MKKAAGYALIYLCAALDLVPWREDGRWYLCGQRGCVLGLASKGFALLQESETASGNPPCGCESASEHERR